MVLIRQLFPLLLLFISLALTAQRSSSEYIAKDNYLEIETYQLITPASLQEKESPAEYRYMKWEKLQYPDSTVEKRYKTLEAATLVKPAAKYYETIPPTFKIEIKKYLTERPKKKRRKYKKIMEPVLIKPEHEIFTVSEPVFKRTFRSRLTREAPEGMPEEHEKYAFVELVEKAKYEIKLIPAEFLEITHWVMKSKKNDD